MHNLEMNLGPTEQLTVKSYNETAKSWAEAHGDVNFWKEELEIFKNLFPKGRILEIGCGGGRDAELLLRAGYSYLGTDPAEKFIKVAKTRNPQAVFEVKSVDDINYPENSFDGFWASAVLLHIPKKKIDLALGNLKKCVKLGGIGFIAIKEGEGEVIKKEESSDGKLYKRFWALYSDKEFRNILERNKMKVRYFIYKPISKRTKWLIYFVEVFK